MHPAVFVLSNHLDTLINYNGGKQSPFNCSKMRYEYLSLIIGIANLIRKKTAGCQKERRKKTPNVFPYIYFKVFPVFIKYKTIVSFLTKERKKKKKRQNVFPYIYFKVFPVFQGLSGNSGLFGKYRYRQKIGPILAQYLGNFLRFCQIFRIFSHSWLT